MPDSPVHDRAAVEAALDYSGCIAALPDAIVRFSRDAVDRPLRQILEVAPDRLFAQMPGRSRSTRRSSCSRATSSTAAGRRLRQPPKSWSPAMPVESTTVTSLAEIGAVVADPAPGRRGRHDVTVYKSLGHIIRDLAAMQYLHDRLSGGV